MSAGTILHNNTVCGGCSENGNVTGNTVAISGGTINSRVHGGYSYNMFDTTANTVQITDNTVRITGGVLQSACGGYSMKGAVKNNTVTLAGGTVTFGVGGGESAYGDVADNTVAITGGTVQIVYKDHAYGVIVYGGSSTYGAAKNNRVNISAGTVNTTYGVNGGRSQTGAATGNTVTISGGTITGKVVGGACYNTATDNKVILAKGAAAAHLNSATLYGSVKNEWYTSLPGTHSGNTLTVEKEKNITVATVKNFDAYDFQLDDVKNGDVILNLLDDTDLGTADVKAEGAITGKRKIYLMKLADGKTLAFTAGTGTTNISNESQNAKKTASLTRTRKVEQEDNNLLLVDNIAYDFGLTPDTMKNGYIFITPADTGNTGATTIDATDVTLDKAGIDGKFLSLSKGDKIYLLQNDGTLTYTGTNGDGQKLDHTYTNGTNDATVTTTGEVAADGNDLVLKIGGVKYNFVLAPTTTDGYTFLTSTNTGETKIDAADVTLDESSLSGKLLSLSKGDTVYLLKNDTTGTLAYNDASGAKELNHTYENSTDAGTATVTTHAKVEASGNDLVLNVDGVKYAFTLAPTVENNNTLLELKYTGDTTISKGDVTVKTSGCLRNLKEGEKVYLLKKTEGGKLIATDITDTVNLPGIFGTITGNVEAEGNALVLNVTKAESLTDIDDSYKYIVIVKDATNNTGNEVTVGAGETAGKSAIAALAKDETVTTELTGNTLTVNGTVTGRAVGANSCTGDVTNNHVIINAGATVNGFVAGGMTADGVADGNIVTINGGTINGDVYGGYVTGTSGTTGSTSGNTLNVTGAATAGNIANFDTYNFYLPAGTSAGDTLLHLTDAADTDMQGSTVNVHADGSTKLNATEKVYLIQKDGGSLLTDAAIKQNVDVLVGVTAKLNGTVTKENNNLVLTTKAVPASSSGGGYFPPSTPASTEKTETTDSSDRSDDSDSSSSSGSSSGSNGSSGSGSSGSSRSARSARNSSSSSQSGNNSNTSNNSGAESASSSGNSGSSSSASTPSVTINPDTKSAVETRAAQSNVLNMGSDFFVNTMMTQIEDLTYGDDGFGAFGGSSGSAHMRYKTGSHVDSRGTAFNAGIAKKNTNKSGTFTWGPFFETGHGNYDSYLDNGTHGSGSTSYTGGGVFARQEFASGCYVEGALRLGKTKADYSSSDLGTSYSTDAPYFGAHLGVGRVLPMHGGSLDIYGRYLYSRTGSDSAHLATGETYDFDAVDSHRLMFGARYTLEMDKLSKWYAGAALLYEFGGEARAHYQGYSLASPSSAGASVMIEGGWKYASSASSPFELDLGATGYLGKQQGLMFHAGVNYAF